MNKEEFIKRHGEAAYKKLLQQNWAWHAAHREEDRVSSRGWAKQHREEDKVSSRSWRAANPDKVKATSQEQSHKGGKYYRKTLKYHSTGLPGERRDIRSKHNYLYRDIKQATPNSVLHHEWKKGTAEYTGVALVEKVAHQNGIIKVIKVLEGKITLFTEEEVKRR